MHVYFLLCARIYVSMSERARPFTCAEVEREQLWRMCSLSSPFSVQTELILSVSPAGTFASDPSCWPLHWPFKVRPLHMATYALFLHVTSKVTQSLPITLL